MLTQKVEGPMRDPRLTKEAAAKLVSRIQAVTKRATSRLASGFVKSAAQVLMEKARDAGTNEVQARYFEALDPVEKYQEVFVGNFVGSLLQQIDRVSDLEAVLERRRKRESGNKGAKLELVDTEKFEQFKTLAL